MIKQVKPHKNGHPYDGKEKMSHITVQIPSQHKRFIDRLVKKDYYLSRSEFIRIAIEKELLWRKAEFEKGV